MLKLGTIGSSWITDSFIEDACATGRYSLYGRYSRTEEKAKDLATKNGCKGFSSLSALAESPVDVVYIASPNSLHFEQIMYFLEASKHVICEKPLVLSADEFEQAYSLAQKKDCYLLEAFRHLQVSGFRFIKENLPKIGRIRNVNIHYNQFSRKYNDFLAGKNPNVFNKEFGGGAVRDLGVYPISLAVALFGEPCRVVSDTIEAENPISSQNTGGSSGVDLVTSLILNYKSFMVNITCSKAAQSVIENEILGEAGAISFDYVQELSRVTFHSAKEELIYENKAKGSRKLYDEALCFARIIEEKEEKTYRELIEISRIVNRLIANCLHIN